MVRTAVLYSVGYDHPLALLLGMLVTNAHTLSMH